MKGKLFITRSGYDPEKGKHVKDPYLGDCPTLGACRTDFRKQVVPGDHIFVISGRIPGERQYVFGGFEVAEKISALEAYERFPQRRLRKMPDGQLAGNVIVDQFGQQHSLDDHSNFERRIENYIVGKNPIALVTSSEVQAGRDQTLPFLQSLFNKTEDSPHRIVTRFGKTLSELRTTELRAWLESLKGH